MKRTIQISVLGLMLVLPCTIRAQGFRTDVGRAEFTSSVPLHSFTGVSNDLIGRIDLESGEVDFYLDLETLKTGIGKRDRDMRKTLETGSFPFAEFFGRLETMVDPLQAGDQPVRVRGSFALHGVEQEIDVEGTIRVAEDGLHLEAAWELSLDDYNIEPPRLLIVKVDPIQKIRLVVHLLPEES